MTTPPPSYPAPGSGPPPPGWGAGAPGPAPSWGPPPGQPAWPGQPGQAGQGGPAWPAPPGGPTPPPGQFLGAAHKPGAFPLRPLNLGAMWDGAFRIIRFNPKATVGAAVLVTSVAMLIPVLVTAVLTFTYDLSLDASGDLSADPTTGEIVAFISAFGSLGLAAIAAQVGVVFVTGMVAHVTRAAAVGRRLDLGEAWALTRGKRWRLLGLTLVVNLMVLALFAFYVLLWVLVVLASSGPWPVVAWALVSIPAFLAGLAWVWTRLYYLPVPALMLEDVGVFASIGRAYRLTSRNFWRTFGIGLLTTIVASVAGSLLSFPVSLVGQGATIALPDYALLILMISQAVSLVLQYAFYAPFVAAVSSVQYIDLRMRSEAFDVELMREAGIIPR